MVRILTCHHFEAQRTAKTEEPVGVAVVDDSVLVVGLEHRINVYYLSDIAGSAKEFDISIWLGKRRRSDFGHGEFGGFYSFARTQKDKEAPVDRAKVGQTGELRLSHYFAPVAVLRYLEYNSRGNQILHRIFWNFQILTHCNLNFNRSLSGLPGKAGSINLYSGLFQMGQEV